MEETWRWFGPEDAITLPEIRQTGARGIVTALHHLPYGTEWAVEEIEKRKAEIAADPALGLHWRVVESLPVAEPIKAGESGLEPLFDAYRASLRNLARCGIATVCYNFMPILDWTRTDLAAPFPGGGTTLRFDACRFAAFDCFMLRRPGAEADHAPGTVARAKTWYERSSESDREKLLASIMAGLPGAFERYDLHTLRGALERYRDIDAGALRDNLKRFLEAVVPTAEDVGIRLCVHPDDPPRPLLGLPRIVSGEDDLAFILAAVDSPANGITVCTGSLGANPVNDVARIVARFAGRIHFAHLRNVRKEPDGSFVESGHIEGDLDMVSVISCLLAEEDRRRAEGRADWRIPMRADHGPELLDDAGRRAHPGYPLIGRLKGLAELRGAIAGLSGAATDRREWSEPGLWHTRG